jgi:hypothetical protein
MMLLKALPGSPLAKARCEAHSAFDPLWQSGDMSRSEAYKWLSQQLKLSRDECHIAMFDDATCRRVVDVCFARDFDSIELTGK